MEEKGREAITAFDTVLTTNRIQMMKVFLSYLAPELQSGLAVYIKFSELQYVMQLARQFPGRPMLQARRTVLSFRSLMDGSLFVKDQAGVLELLDELLPFSSPSERKRILDLKNMLAGLGRMREMMEMMEMMKELFPEGMGDGGGGFADMFSAMGSMGGEGMSGIAGMAGMAGMGDMFSGMDPSALAQLMQMFQAPGDGSGDGGDDGHGDDGNSNSGDSDDGDSDYGNSDNDNIGYGNSSGNSNNDNSGSNSNNGNSGSNSNNGNSGNSGDSKDKGFDGGESS